MKVCLVLDSEFMIYDHYREVESLLNEEFEIPLLLIDETTEVDDWMDYPPLRKFGVFLKNLFQGNFMVFIFLERMIANYLKPKSTVSREYKTFTRRMNVIEHLPELNKNEMVRFKPEKVTGLRYDFPVEIIEKIKQTCDVVVLLGFNRILTGKILHAASFGVMSFHGADINKYRGRPGQFFEWINNEKQVGVTLQKLNESLDGGKILLLRHADITDAKSWEEVRVRSMRLRGNMVSEGLKKLEKEQDALVDPEHANVSHKRDGHKFTNVMRCIIKNVKCRYFT